MLGRIPLIELNEYIEKFSEIKPHLDLIIEDINITLVKIKNDGCKSKVVLQVFRHLHNHDISTARG